MEARHRNVAFVAHQSLSLHDSNVVFISPRGKKIAFFGFENGDVKVDIRTDWAPLKEENVQAALCSFCQKIWLRDLAMSSGMLAGVCIVAQNLLQASNPDGSFSREALSFGIQGLQELNWTRQNTEFLLLFEKHAQGVEVDTVDKKYVWTGPDDRFFIEIDGSMFDKLGMVRFRIHDVDIGQAWSKKSYQVFTNVRHPYFLQAFDSEGNYGSEIWELFGRILRVSLIIFEEAAIFMSHSMNRTEEKRLVETIKKGEFYGNSVQMDNRPNEAVPFSLSVALDDDDTSDDILGVSPGTLRSQTLSSRPSSPALSPSSSSTIMPDQDTKKKRREKQRARGREKKKKRQQARRRETDAAETVAEQEQFAQAHNDNGELPSEFSVMSISVPSTSTEAYQDQTTETGRHHEEGDASEAASPKSSNSDKTTTQTAFDGRAGTESSLLSRQSTVHDNDSHNNMAAYVDNAHSNVQVPAGGSASIVREFKFDGFDPRLRCPKPDCRRMTSCWDPVVVICPACGTHSYTRYCRKEHLYEDIQRHWVVECTHRSIASPVDSDTIRQNQLPKSSYITGHFANHIERHRQAVYRAMETSDYFIFSDRDNLASDTPTREEWNLVRGTGTVLKSITFPYDGTLLSPSAFFNHHIQQCLKFGGPLAENSNNIALHMIREALIVEGSWSEDMLTHLCMQIAYEWNGWKVPEFFYNVDEVNAVYRSYGILPPPPSFHHV